MRIHGVFIEDTFAEAFGMRAARLVITAQTATWARQAATACTGFATSVIGCKCEAAIEREVAAADTPDARPGLSVLCFAMDVDGLSARLTERIGQTVLTCPTANCFDGLPGAATRVAAGRPLRTFGDGFQISKVVGGERYWRIPVMDGECVVQESFGIHTKGVAGGNFLILGEDGERTLAAAEAAASAMAGCPDVILPFPGGIVRSGSKVGARRYPGMKASTNDAYAPTLRPVTRSALPPEVHAVLEIVIDGLSIEAVARAMRAGILAACRPGIVAISAGNYGGTLGPYHLRLREVLA